MAAMSENAYKLLGYAVWRGGKWYLRRRLPSARLLAGIGLGAGSAVLVAALLARRVSA
jgi:hypothetical protein